jgi:hypothetical protein
VTGTISGRPSTFNPSTVRVVQKDSPQLSCKLLTSKRRDSRSSLALRVKVWRQLLRPLQPLMPSQSTV